MKGKLQRNFTKKKPNSHEQETLKEKYLQSSQIMDICIQNRIFRQKKSYKNISIKEIRNVFVLIQNQFSLIFIYNKCYFICSKSIDSYLFKVTHSHFIKDNISHMFKKVSTLALASTAASLFFLNHNKIQLTNPYLRTALEFLHNKNTNYSTFFLTSLIRMGMIRKNSNLQSFVLTYGTDYDGYLLESFAELGFNAVQVGPVSLVPSIAEQSRTHCGSKIALSNINTYFEKLEQKNIQLSTKIGVCIEPNYEIAKYTPYLVAENVFEVVKEFQIINENFKTNSLSYYMIKLNTEELKTIKKQQYLSLVRELINQCSKIIKINTERRNAQMKDPMDQIDPHLRRAQLHLEIPSKAQNPELYEMVIKNCGQELQCLVVDGSEYQILRNFNKKILPSEIKLSLGRKRLTYIELIDRIVDEKI